jgi:hypothetical protein
MIRYTQKVRNILAFIDKYGFITSYICGNLFYKENKCKIDMARKVLNRLVKNGDIIVNKKSKFGKELIYQHTKNIVSDHSYYLLNLYAEINTVVTKVEYFTLEQTWNTASKTRRSDAHIIFYNTVDGEYKFKSYLIEFDKYHKTNPVEKYNEIYDYGDVQDWYKRNCNMDDYFPDVMIINYSGKCEKSNREEFKIIGLDYDFTDLTPKLLLA